jgi:hypothetical protein
LEIASLFVSHCTFDFNTADGLSVGSFVANSIQDLINLGIVLIYVIPLVIDLSQPFLIAHVIVLAIISLIFVPFVVVDALFYLGPLIVSTPSPDTALNLAAAYLFLLLCVAAYCVGVLIFSRFMPRTDGNARKVS